MWTFIGRRLLEAIPVLWIVATLTFFMVRLAPGGPFDSEKDMSPEVREAVNAYYGLDQPLGAQYLQFLGNLLKGDLGPSYQFPGWTVNELIAAKFPISFELGFYALLVALLIGITLGVLAAIRPNTWSDYLPMSLAMIGICLPTFVLGPLLLMVFGLQWEIVNVMGWNFPRDRILPSLALGLFYAAYIARLTRASMVDIRTQDFIRTAQAKGLPWWRVYFVHGLKNGICPVISYLGPAAAGLLSGSFVIETVFNIPGLGKFFVGAAIDSDYTMVVGTVIFYAAILVLFNLVADILLALVNPRQKLA